MACQSVTRTAGNDTQSGFRMYQRTGNFIDSSIPSDGNDSKGLFCCLLCCNFYGMSGILSVDNLFII